MLINLIYTHERGNSFISEVQQNLLIKCREWVEDQLSRFDNNQSESGFQTSTRPQTAKTVGNLK